MKYLMNIDLNKNELQNARIQNLASNPINPKTGQIYYNSGDKTFYGWNGTKWIDLGQELTGNSIIALINSSNSIISDDNLSTNVADALTKRHNHSNMTILSATEQAFTTALLNKVNGIEAGAEVNKVTSVNNKTGAVVISKSDVGLGSVDNKSSAIIRDEITASNINKALGFTPKNIIEGLEGNRPTATGSSVVYIATDTKKIWFDNGSWIQIGGQDTIAWGNITSKPSTFPPSTHNHDTLYLGKTSKAESAKSTDAVAWDGVTGKPSTYTPPVASETRLGGIKVGANLSIDASGVLSASDDPVSYLVKQEKFIATEGQTVFNLIKGQYRLGLGALSVYLYGSKLSNDAFVETSTTRFTLKTGLSAGDLVIAEYVELINVEPYPHHANEHLTDGADPIAKATTSQDGLMAKEDKSKLNGIATGANKYVHPGSGTNPHGTTKSDVGLGSVENKSSATIRGEITKANITSGLGYTPLNENLKGANNGLAELDSSGLVPASQLPSYVDDVMEFANKATFPILGENDKIYIAMDTNIIYRWGGTGYIEISSTIALGETMQTAYRGDKGKVAYDHSQSAHAPANAQKNSDITKAEIEAKLTGIIGTHSHTVTKTNVGLGNVDNVKQATKVEFDDHDGDTAKHITGAERTAWNAKETPAGAQAKANTALADAKTYTDTHDNNTTKHITITERNKWNAKVDKYAVNVGGSTTATITHNLGTMDVTVSIREAAAPYNAVMTDWQIIDSNSIRLTFAIAPASGQYRVVVVG